MILTVCLSPCIDVNIEVDTLGVGRSNKIISKRIYFTGKALNVAIGIARLNGEAFATGFMNEVNGSQFEQKLHREGVPYKFVWNEGRVRENYKFIDRKSMLTEVDDVSPHVSEEKQRELLSLIGQLSRDCEAVVLSGGLTKGMSPEYYGEVFSAVPQSVKKIVDADCERLFSSLKYGMDLVKTNVEMLENTVGRKLRTIPEMLDGCNEIVQKGAKRVLLSLGKKGAIITDGNKNLFCKSINVAMNSTLGAGDGMVAAATNALAKGADLGEILRCGVAGGTATVTSAMSISFSKAKYDEILKAISVKEI